MTGEINQRASTASRRRFLKLSGVAATSGVAAISIGSTGLMLGLTLPERAVATVALHQPNAWVHIAEDNTITLISARSEMGQGVYTTMPMLIAEELNVNIQKIKVVTAPPHVVYSNALLGAQITGGSTSAREGWEKLRLAGAQVREMLRAAAAIRWGVDLDKVSVSNAMLLGPNGIRATYGEMASAASAMPIPSKPRLKAAKDFQVIGKSIKRIDTPAKTNGSAQFGIDVKLPGMLYASLEQCPVIGGKVKSFDATAAKATAGVIDVVQIPDGIAVVAHSYWQAVQARKALKVQWDEGAVVALSDTTMTDATRAALSDGKTKVLPIIQPMGDVAKVFANAAKVVKAEYVTPLQAHATLEPMNFTANCLGFKCHLIGPTQFQQGAVAAVAAALGIKSEDVSLETSFLGGGFGRRLELDFIIQAAQISKAVGRPIKLIWSREDDTTHDFYRPLGINQLSAALNAVGNPAALHFKVASQSITQRAFGLPKDTLDPFMTEAAVAPYTIPNTQHDLVIYDTGFRVGYWRAVSHNMNCFANECFIDELAKAAGHDPYQYRLTLLTNKPRLARVLRLVAEKAGWGKKLPANRALGIALQEGYGTFMAQVAEVSVNEQGIKVHKVSVAVDAGQLINPDTVEAQIQSSIVFGISAALLHKVSVKNGRVQESNFNNYPVLRMPDAPQIEVVLVNSSEKPGGVGEPATSLVVPAIANAVATLTGKRLRSLPMTAEALRASST